MSRVEFTVPWVGWAYLLLFHPAGLGADRRVGRRLVAADVAPAAAPGGRPCAALDAATRRGADADGDTRGRNREHVRSGDDARGPMLAPMAQRVLVVEDEEDIAFPLVRTLEREGYDVEWVESGQKALDTLASDARARDPRPGAPGHRRPRGLSAGSRSRLQGAIIIVTARAGELDRVVGLDYGADDYLAKPFGLAELQARVRALLRRTSSTGRDRGRRRVRPTGCGSTSTPAGSTPAPRRSRSPARSSRCSNILAANRDKVVSRGRLMADVWDENWYGSTKTLDVTIGRLRQKLESRGRDRSRGGRSRRGFPPRRRHPRCVSGSPLAFIVLSVVLLLGAGAGAHLRAAGPDPRAGRRPARPGGRPVGRDRRGPRRPSGGHRRRGRSWPALVGPEDRLRVRRAGERDPIVVTGEDYAGDGRPRRGHLGVGSPSTARAG